MPWCATAAPSDAAASSLFRRVSALFYSLLPSCMHHMHVVMRIDVDHATVTDGECKMETTWLIRLQTPSSAVHAPTLPVSEQELEEPYARARPRARPRARARTRVCSRV